jgi:hypothetical protein
MPEKKIDVLNLAHVCARPMRQAPIASLRYAFRLLELAERYMSHEEREKVKDAMQNARDNIREALKRLDITDVE